MGKKQWRVCVRAAESELWLKAAVSVLPVVLPGFVERAVRSQTAELLTETREPQREEEEDHRQDEEEDDKQGGLDRVGLWTHK